MTDVPDLCDRLRAFHSKIMNEAADALEQEVKNWKQRNNSALAAEAQRDALAEKLIDATQRLEDSNDILAKLIDAEAEIRRLRGVVGKAREPS